MADASAGTSCIQIFSPYWKAASAKHCANSLAVRCSDEEKDDPVPLIITLQSSRSESLLF